MIKKGSSIIYPHYGAGKIVDKEVVALDDEDREYYVVEIYLRDLRIMLPREQLKNGNFRKLVGKSTFLKKLRKVKKEILNDDYKDGNVPKVPRPRLEEMEINIVGGDLEDTLEALARLHARFTQRDMNIGEKRVYDIAKEFCIGEMMGIYQCNELKAKEKLSNYLPSVIPKLQISKEKPEEVEASEEGEAGE